MASVDQRPARGRILRLKRGTNPNSSSVGSDIPAFLYSAGALTLLGVILASAKDLIGKRFKAGAAKHNQNEKK